jgi:hypothetical protein
MKGMETEYRRKEGRRCSCTDSADFNGNYLVEIDSLNYKSLIFPDKFSNI